MCNMGRSLQMASDEKENSFRNFGARLCSFCGFVFVNT